MEPTKVTGPGARLCTPSLITCKLSLLSSMVVVFTALTIYGLLAGSFSPAWV